jgi:hypothetical protein
MGDDLFFALLFVAISVTMNLVLAIAWFRSTRRASRYEKRLFAAPPTFDRRVEHLESVLDSVAGQVDRLANGQEFLSRIMGERSTRGAERPQVETPH